MNPTVSFFSQFSIVKINYFPLSAHTLGNAALIPCGRLIFLGPAHPRFPTYKKNDTKLSLRRTEQKRGNIFSGDAVFWYS